MTQDETPFNDFHAPTYYKAPDTSDKTDEETWSEYWDRKRVEKHGPRCSCMICANAERLKALAQTILPTELREWLADDLG